MLRGNTRESASALRTLYREVVQGRQKINILAGVFEPKTSIPETDTKFQYKDTRRRVSPSITRVDLEKYEVEVRTLC